MAENVLAKTLRIGDEIQPIMREDGEERPMESGRVTRLILATTMHNEDLIIVDVDHSYTIAFGAEEEVYCTRH